MCGSAYKRGLSGLFKARGGERQISDFQGVRYEEDIGFIISAVTAGTGLDKERAKLFHLESWIFVHGIAAMLATSYIDFDEEFISETLTDMFEGLKARFGSK